MSSLIQRKGATNSVNNQQGGDSSTKFKENPPPLRRHKLFVRMILATALAIIFYFSSNKEKTTTLAGYKEIVALREHKLTCTAESFAHSENFPKCISFCKRFVTDNLLNEHEISHLRDLSSKIFDLSDESSKTYSLNSDSERLGEVTKNLHDTIKSIQPKIIENIAQRFEIAFNSLYLTSPTFFAKFTNVTSEYSESFHRHHYDKENHKHVQYTVIMFLSSFKREFTGGRFIFVDMEKNKKKSVVVDPKSSRTVVFSAGPENTFFIENIKNGQLLFLALSFTCDSKLALTLK